MKSVILRGKAGTGKTSFTEEFSKKINAKYFYYLCHEWTTNEELLYSIDISKVTTKKANPYKRGILAKAIEASKTQKVVVCIDELDKAKEKVDTLLLDFLQNCRINDPDDNFEFGKSENLFVFITTNEKRPLLDPLLRRGFKFHMNFLPPDVEKGLLMNDSTYYIDSTRDFLLTYLTTDKNKTEKKDVQNLIINVANKLRKANLDISLYELKNLYNCFFICLTREQYMLAIIGWLGRSDDYIEYLITNYKSIENLANSFQAMMEKTPLDSLINPINENSKQII